MQIYIKPWILQDIYEDLTVPGEFYHSVCLLALVLQWVHSLKNYISLVSTVGDNDIIEVPQK